MNQLVSLAQSPLRVPVYIADASSVIRLSLSIVIIGIAVFGSRWLAALASRMPAYPRYLGHGGHRDRSELTEKHTTGRLLGTITLASIWLLATVVILLIWFSDQTVAALVTSPKNLETFLATLALRIIGSLLVLACMLGFGRLFQRMIEARLIHAHISRNVVLLAGRTVYISSFVVGIIVILGLWGAGLVVPVAVGGALTVALTLSLQDVLRNLVSGVYLLLEHTFVIGDRITVAPYTGQIEDIQIRFTSLRTEDNQRVLIPNSMLFTGAVVNLSSYDASRGVLLISLPDQGGDWIDGVEDKIRSTLSGTTGIRSDPPPQILINGTSAGKIQLEVVFWLPVDDQDIATDMSSRVIIRLRDALPEAEVTRPSGQVGPGTP